MKIKRFSNLKPAGLLALGIFLGRGAHADTILDFNSLPAGQIQNSIINQGFGSFATTSSSGITVTGFGTPNIALNWAGIGASDTEWDYYYDGGVVWTAVQLNNSDIGYTHRLTFIPNSTSARVVVKSFNFNPYYVSTERFTYNVSLLAGTNVVNGPTKVTFISDATTNHPVNLNYTGAPGQTLKLRLDRIASTLGPGEVEGGAYNIAVDDIIFAQSPTIALPSGPQVVSVSPSDDQTGVPGTYYPYLASITNKDTTLVASSIRLQLDGSPVSPAPSISTSGGLTNVSFPGTNLVSSGSHFYTLTYSDNLGATYTNQVEFTSLYTTLPATYALPPGSGVTRGFTFRTVAAPLTTTNTLDSTVARAVAQLNGTLIDPSTGAPYVNSAIPGTNDDGSYSIDTVLNFNGDTVAVPEGDFPNDQLFPGVPFFPMNWYSTEALLFLDLPAGYYRLGVNSDDGFEVNSLPPQGVSGSSVVLGIFDNGRGAADTLFDIQVLTSGVYPFQVIYFQSTGKSTEEFFSVTNLATGDKILINDPAYSNAIKSYRVLRPHMIRIVRNGSNAVIDWAYGTAPFQLQFKGSLTNSVWSNVGSPTTNHTATVAISPGGGFFRVFGQ